MRYIVTFLMFAFISLGMYGQIPEGEYAITASSTLPAGSSSDFSPDNLMDGGPDSWAESAEGTGIGEVFTLELRYPDKLQYVMIRNGLGREKYWDANARVKKLKISWGNGPERVIHVRDIPEVEVYGFYDPGNQPGNGGINSDLTDEQKFTFEIMDTYPGSRWEDLCIAEIGLNQWNYDGFDMPEDYIIKNIYREYFNGILDTRGNLYTEDPMIGYKMADIQNGYLEQDLMSGDGTSGIRSYQVFVTGTAPASYLLHSSAFSEISQESMEGKLDENGNPYRIESYLWDILYYNPGKQDFEAFDKSKAGFIFDTPPWLVFSWEKGYEISSEDIWVFIEKPGTIGARLLEDPEGKILYYSWNGNQLVMQTEY